MDGESHSTPALVVCIGASAGGIEAMKEFFATMPADSGLAFVVIQHLEPNHESRMPDILSQWTAMHVAQAENNLPVRANRVYVNPPDKYVSMDAGRLELRERSEPAESGCRSITFWPPWPRISMRRP